MIMRAAVRAITGFSSVFGTKISILSEIRFLRKLPIHTHSHLFSKLGRVPDSMGRSVTLTSGPRRCDRRPRRLERRVWRVRHAERLKTLRLWPEISTACSWVPFGSLCPPEGGLVRHDLDGRRGDRARGCAGTRLVPTTSLGRFASTCRGRCGASPFWRGRSRPNARQRFRRLLHEALLLLLHLQDESHHGVVLRVLGRGSPSIGSTKNGNWRSRNGFGACRYWFFPTYGSVRGMCSVTVVSMS